MTIVPVWLYSPPCWALLVSWYYFLLQKPELLTRHMLLSCCLPKHNTWFPCPQPISPLISWTVSEKLGVNCPLSLLVNSTGVWRSNDVNWELDKGLLCLFDQTCNSRDQLCMVILPHTHSRKTSRGCGTHVLLAEQTETCFLGGINSACSFPFQVNRYSLRFIECWLQFRDCVAEDKEEEMNLKLLPVLKEVEGETMMKTKSPGSQISPAVNLLGGPRPTTLSGQGSTSSFIN